MPHREDPTSTYPALDTARAAHELQECRAALSRMHVAWRCELAHRKSLQAEVRTIRAAAALSHADETQARYQSMHDELTALPNRRFLLGRFNHLLAETEPPHGALAALYIDLDGFKRINDEHGHDAGDSLLKVVAMRMRRAVRAEDMVCRLGGDEFACLIAGLPSRGHVSQLACKILDTVCAPMRIGRVGMTVRASIGVAMWPADGVTAQSMMRNADAAMYRAKRQRAGYAFFSECTDIWAAEPA